MKALLALALLALGCSAAPPPPPPATAPPAPAPPGEVASNLLRQDYAGSAECADCHPDIYAAWQGSPMRGMTRDVAGAVVRGDFSQGSFQVGPDALHRSQEGARRFFELAQAGKASQRFEVTRIIGGRTREDYVGRPVDAAGQPLPGAPERVMPVSFVFDPPEWRYKGYSVMTPERPGMRPGPVWHQTCLFCHNTVPYLATIYDDLAEALPGPPLPKYQGSVSERLLPADRIWRPTVHDAAGLIAAIQAEIRHLGFRAPTGGLPEVLRGAALATRQRFDAPHLVEVGIGCEACHGGSRAHAADPDLRPAPGPRSPLLRVGPEAPSRAAETNRMCGRCHTVLFSGYPHTWEGSHRSDAPGQIGGSHINSGEARDLLLGGCADALSCADCHDPHRHDAAADLEALAGPKGDRLCTGCHAELAAPEAHAAHAHHDPQGAGGACVGCHMPRKNMALGYTLTRYHRIGRPNDPIRVERDRPLECALCHPTEPVEGLVATMEAWWGGPFDRGALQALYGPDLGVDALGPTLALGHPHERAVAAAVIGERGLRQHALGVADVLGDPIPLVRYFARAALGRLFGAPPPLDPAQPGAAVQAAARRWVEAQPAPAP